MKIIIYIITLIIINSSYTAAQTGWLKTTIGNKSYTDINFINDNTGYIVRKDSAILKTTNKGSNWIVLNTHIPSQNGNIACGYFTSENLSALGSLGVVYKSTNGGINWIAGVTPSQGIGSNLMSMFLNDNLGFSCGWDAYPFPTPSTYDGVFWRTTNGGFSWSDILRVNATEFRAFNSKGQDTISILSLEKIYYTNNGGQNWSSINFSVTPEIYSQAFSNPFKDTIFIAGGGGIIRSTNSGNNWSYSLQIARTNYIRRVHFFNTQKGFAVGDSGQIYFTSNSGTNWLRQASNSLQKFNSLYFLNQDTGFVVGDSGLVLRTYTGGIVSIATTETEVTKEPILYQNYPNPFNPATTIKFKLNKTDYIKIKIFDIAGKEIETLATKSYMQGEHQIIWNTKDNTSGVYFCVLETTDKKLTKKLLLIK